MHLITGLPIGIVLFTLAITGVALGVGLLPLFLLGIPVLIVTFWIIGMGARFERARHALLLGVTITPPTALADERWWPRFLRRLRSASTWKQLAYCVLSLPIGVIDFTLTLVLWSVAASLIALPSTTHSSPREAPRSAASCSTVGGSLRARASPASHCCSSRHT